MRVGAVSAETRKSCQRERGGGDRVADQPAADHGPGPSTTAPAVNKDTTAMVELIVDVIEDHMHLVR